MFEPPEKAGFGIVLVQVFFLEASLRDEDLLYGVFFLIAYGDMVLVLSSNDVFWKASFTILVIFEDIGALIKLLFILSVVKIRSYIQKAPDHAHIC